MTLSLNNHKITGNTSIIKGKKSNTQQIYLVKVLCNTGVLRMKTQRPMAYNLIVCLGLMMNEQWCSNMIGQRNRN